ncbi:TPA: mobilization protein [Aeromonas sobria]|nr:mobilization protein [Aeromonas sobria]
MTVIEQRIEALEKKLKQAKAERQRKEARIKAQDRKRSREQDTRRKILIGAVYLAMAESDDAALKALTGRMDKALSRDDDRALFDLAPLQKEDPDHTAKINVTSGDKCNVAINVTSDA